MSFWNLSNGENLAGSEVETTFNMGGDSTPIPNKTDCLAVIEEAKWDSYKADWYISLKWRVMKPDEYGNRVVFQKVKVLGTEACKDKAATADKAKRMLLAIDANAGGKLRKINRDPLNEDLTMCLCGKPMIIKVMVWQIKDDSGTVTNEGNWVGAVSPSKARLEQAMSAPSKPFTPSVTIGDDNDVPF